MVKIKIVDNGKELTGKGYRQVIEQLNNSSLFGACDSVFDYMNQSKELIKQQTGADIEFHNDKEFIQALKEQGLIEILS